MALTPRFGRTSGNKKVWDPFSSTIHGSVFEPLSGFSSAFDRPFGRGGDWVETPEAHVFKKDVPGMKKEEIKVEVVDGRTLSVSGESSRDSAHGTDSWRRLESSHGKFHRQFGLPEDAKLEEVTAKVDNGVLTVTIPKLRKTETSQVRSIEIA